jgi:hypothetical protein
MGEYPEIVSISLRTSTVHMLRLSCPVSTGYSVCEWMDGSERYSIIIVGAGTKSTFTIY